VPALSTIVQKGNIVELKRALQIVSRQRPCPHDNFDPNLGDGKSWGKCEDCGSTFLRSNHERHRDIAKEFERAIHVLATHLPKE
jgi:hypothetical protein